MFSHDIKERPFDDNIPLHIAVIMDGNGRWARERGLPRSAGHKKGADAIHELLSACKEKKVLYLTLYAFSSENWQRSVEEVDNLMGLLRYYLDTQLEKLHEEGACLKIIGDRSKLANDINEKISKAEFATKDNKAIYLNMALSYGARQEIISAVQKIAEQVSAGHIKIEDINEDLFSQSLYTNNLPDPDLLIRTGAQKRLSNFLLWQSAYTELLFLDILWPDFRAADLIAAIAEFKNRERRYGT